MSKKVVISGINTAYLPKLSAKEGEELLIKIKREGREDLRQEFLLGNMRLVLSLIQRFSNCRECGDDLFQVGMLGLIKALDNFNIDMNVMFSTYAVPMILGEIRRYLREGTAMKVGRNLRDIAYRAIKARERIESENVREASLMEIAAEIDVPYAEVVSALDAIAEPISLYDNAYSDSDDSIMVLDQISDKRTPEDLINFLVLRGEIEKLPEREKDIIKQRYYLGKTQMEISSVMNMSQAQVSRIEKNALNILKAAF
ncbi:MAG: sigma-70 family RNA polymerase sigma factor [Christensenellales bacterium]|jgi:RNA polymerase sporulation-specific sigma factor